MATSDTSPQAEPAFLRIPISPEQNNPTQPVRPSARLPDNQVSIQLCTPADAPIIARGMYACWPETSFVRCEPPELRPAPAERLHRMTQRIQPMLTEPKMQFVKAVHVPSGEVMGVAGWMAPGLPVHNPWLRSAVEFYGFREKMGWSEADVNRMWEGVSSEGWDGAFGPRDEDRKKVMGDEPHWFLAPLLTFPEWQGKGVGSRLIKWAIEQADATDPPTPMYLESAATARAVYIHHGFVPLGEVNMVRRGPVVVKKLEEEAAREGSKVEKVNIDTVAKEVEEALAS